ncbi:uncharacterized protein LOC143595730 [Bidens hawaiensis]|uniref:uncharacterized protein LOC143595730 n=1 Tax=Bidens hawaiensis TaxID=980011 RepID=UPI004049B033
MAKVPYASAVGSLMYAMVCTRPDIAHAVGVVSRFMSDPGKEHWEAVKWLLRYLKGTSSLGLCFKGKDTFLRGYSDADLGGCKKTFKSTTGYVFTVGGTAVCWMSRLQKSVALSTTEAEYMAAAEASKELVWLRTFLEELGKKQAEFFLYCDNESAVKLAKNPVYHSKTKHIGRRYHFVRDLISDGVEKANVLDYAFAQRTVLSINFAIANIGTITTGEEEELLGFICYRGSVVDIMNEGCNDTKSNIKCFLMGYQVLLHLKLGIILSVLAGVTYCKHTPASLFSDHTYITEAYFQKHDTLIDRVFEDFILSELSHAFYHKESFMPKLLVMQRRLVGEGSHRRLTSSVEIGFQPEAISKLHSLSCEAVVIERLPSGVFADPFELQYLTERGVFSGASAFGDTDLELPTVRANRSVAEVHVDLSPDSLSGNNKGWELNIEIPLHARYAPLGNHGYTRVEFAPPNLFVHCIVKGDPLNQSCIFSSTIEGVRSSSPAIVWEVPSGIVEHTKIVSMATFISAVLGALSIFIACIYYSEISVYNDSKQS